MFAGLFVMLLSSILQQVTPPQAGEYYYSDFLKNNYTVLTACIFFGVGGVVGFYLKVNPWLAGISLVAIFPIAAIYEAIVYRVSHNLIPFELFFHFLFSLPAIAGIYLGRFLLHRITMHKSVANK